MARYDGKLQAEREATAGDLRLLLTAPDAPRRSAAERQEAIICLLSASEGWRDASNRTGGAFADEPGKKQG